MSIPLATLRLLEGTTLQRLEELYHIHAKRHTKYHNLVLLKYDQIDSPMEQRIVKECRGLILDEDHGWRVVSRPFDKFFNYGEHLAAPIDWSSARVYEKLDGSLIQMYWYNGQWRVGTSGTPDASGMVGDNGFTFEDLFWRTFIEKGWLVPKTADNNGLGEYTFLFELMTPYNRVVVRHKGNDLKLIGVRRNRDGQEFHVPDSYREYESVRSFPLQSLAELTASFDKMDPLVQEGYVVCDNSFQRVKVKHPGYVALHHMIDGFGPKTILEVIRSGETSEVIANFPEWKVQFEEIRGKFDSLVSKAEDIYKIHHDVGDQKDFAMRVKDQPFSGALFNLRKGKVQSIREAFKVMHIDKLREMVGV